MRIAVVVKYYPPMKRVSGIVGFLSVLLRHIGGEHEIHVVTHRPARDPQQSAVIDGVTIHRVRGLFPVASARKVRSLETDVVMFVSGIFALRLAAPYYALFSALIGMRLPRIFMQATHPDRVPGRSMVGALTGTHTVLAASSDIATSFRTACGDRVGLLQPAVDLPAEAKPETNDTVHIGFINHFNEVKGADVAVEAVAAALASNPSATAIFAGTGDLEDMVKARFADNDRVQIRGFIEATERLHLIQTCDVMVLPFRQAVSVLGVSQTVLEVMAAGRVVLGTPTASITPAITDDANGVLSELDAMSDRLVELVNDPDQRRRLGHQARIDAVEHWDITQRAAAFVEVARATQVD